MEKVAIKNIISAIESVAPPALQDSWDNSGLLVGDANCVIDSALITIDVTEAVVDEAIAKGCGLIIAHHPVIFNGFKRLTGKNESERVVIKAVKKDIAIYAAHTNIDLVRQGVSWRMANKLGLQNIQTLIPQKGMLKKLVTFVPVDDASKVRNAIFDAGAGHIGNYDMCSFNGAGEGSFRGSDTTNPHKGVKGELHFENEIRIETVFPAFIQNKIIEALLNAHPYEEVAYDIYSLENEHQGIGLGVIGNLPLAEDCMCFLGRVKDTFLCQAIRHTPTVKDKVEKIALVGGSGSSFLKAAMAQKADVFITADFKYHQFFDAENKIVIADIGHYESEQFTKELFYEIVTNKFSKFALRLSEVVTNPINYLF
jgi:dinuclear metal center YbgI/SA1388 family protein